MKQVVLGLCAAGLIAAPLASATSLGLSGGGLGTGGAPVPACDTSFTFAYTTSAGAVTNVTVGDISDPACEGGSLSLTLTGSTGASIASGGPQVIPSDADADPDSLAVAVSPQPVADQVAGVRIAITGP